MKIRHKIPTRKLKGNEEAKSTQRVMLIEDAVVRMFTCTDQDALSTFMAMVAIVAARVERIIRCSPTPLYGFPFTAEDRDFIHQCATQGLDERHLRAAAFAISQFDRIEFDGAEATEDEVAFATIKAVRWILREVGA